MSANLSPIGNSGTPFLTSQGVVLSGGKLYTYQAGSTTAAATYADSAQITQNANPIILNSAGLPTSEIWLTAGQAYKFILTDSLGNNVWPTPLDNVKGINDANNSASEWVATGITPTYVSATQFTTSGNTTSTYQVSRRIRATVTAGTVYGTITVSSFASSTTTVTVVLDSGSLDSGLSAVDVALISATHDSVPSTLVHSLTVPSLTSTGAATVSSGGLTVTAGGATIGGSVTVTPATNQTAATFNQNGTGDTVIVQSSSNGITITAAGRASDNAGQLRFEDNSLSTVLAVFGYDGGGAAIIGGSSKPIRFGANNTADQWEFDTSNRLFNKGNTQTRFQARRITSNQSTGNIIIYNTADENIGSAYSTSTGNFTVPITGVYIFSAGAKITNNSGSTINYDFGFSFSSTTTYSPGQTLTLATSSTALVSCSTGPIKLAAGETVHFSSGTTLSGAVFAVADTQSFFTGALLY